MSKLSVINELEKAGAEFEIVHEQAPLGKFSFFFHINLPLR